MTEPYLIGEAVGKRTRSSKHYLRSDGSYQAVISMFDQHVADASGNWHNVDTALVDEADFDAEEISGRPVAGHIQEAFLAKAAELRAHRRAGGAVNRDQTNWRTLRVAHDVSLPKNLKRGYSIGHGADRLTFVPVGASPSRGEISPNDTSMVEYQDVWPLTDVQLTVTASGLKETLVVKAGGGPVIYSTEVQGPLADDLTCGSLRVHHAWLEDAAGTRRDVPTVRTERSGKVYVDLTPDYTGLTFPVRIDPTVTFSVSAYGHVERWSSSYPPSGTINVYTSPSLLSVQRTFDGSTYDIANTVVRWDTSTLAGVAIVGARVKFWVNPSGSDSDGRNVTSDWYNDPLSASSYTATAGTTAISAVDITSLDRTNAGNTVTLSGPGTYINRSGYSGLRFHISGGQPGGRNWVQLETGGSTSPQLIVDYNSPPGAPTVTSPNGGETWNASHTVTWTAATDADTPQASLQYQVQLSTDNQATWSDLVALTAAGATSAAVDLSAKPESSTCWVRVRAYDGASYGPWDVSNGAFTIAHNQAPLMPSTLSPSGGTAVDRAAVQRLSWQHNDPNSSDPQSTFDLQWSSDNGSTWTTVTQATPNQYWDAPGGTFTHGNIVWKVRTYDQADLSGPYSDQVTFLAGDKPAAPVIVSPADGATTELSRPTLQWSSAGQVGYQTQALTLDGAVVWDSGDVTSANKAATVGADLANLTSYTLQVRIRNTDGLWGDYDSITINVSYAPPVAGPFTVAAVNASGYNRVTFSGQGADVASNDLYRRAPGGAWIRIATDLAVNATCDDYTAASGVAYEYQGQAIGTNGVATATDVTTATLALTGVWVHDVADASTLLHLTRNVARGDEWLADVTMLRFAGRDRPVAAFGTTADGALHLQFLITDRTELDGLQALAQRLVTLCVRDNSGRRVFGVIPGVPVEDRLGGFWTVSVDVQEVDHDEEV